MTSIVKIFLGKTNSGKSWLANKQLKERSKAIVYDYAHVFEGKIIENFDLNYLSKLLTKYGGKKNITKKYKLIFRKPSNMTHQTALDLVALFAKKLGESYGKRSLPENDLIAFVIDEADKCTTKKDSDRVRLAVQAGRHDNLSTWGIAQRPSRIHPDFRYNASEIFAFPLASEDKFYKEIFGREAISILENESTKKYSYVHWLDSGLLEIVNPKGKVTHDLSK